MKNLFTFLMILLFSTASMMAQTIVGTDPENKNVILEEYTGIHCTYCPDGHAIAQSIYDNNPEDVVLINIHEGPYAAPNSGEPDFRTPFGAAIAGEAGSSSVGWPSGSVNRHIFTGGQSAMSRSQWVSRSNQVLAESSYLNIELDATIVTPTRQLIVYVEVYYTDDSPVETNFLNIAILQNNILGPQTGGGMGNNYVHMHMLRHLITGQWGVEIDETSAGSFYSGTFYYTLPMDYIDVDVIMEDLDVVGFVTETHQEAISGNMAEMTLVESLVPVVDFEGSPLSGYPPLSVDFTNLSTGIIDTWDWTFGDGNTSSVENPTNIYTTPGTYTVSLTAIGPDGTDTETIVDYIEVVPLPPAPVADFEADGLTGQAPFTVQFTDLSTSLIEDWDWDFGNGGFATLENPSFTYAIPGTYTVSLTVSGPGGSDNETKIEYITVTEAAPEPDFMSDYTYGPAPLTVNFTDMSTGTVDSWLWEFGDGSTSDEQNPQHIFAEEEYFDVSLTTTGPGGTETIIKESFINTLDLVSAIISATPEVICNTESSQLDAEASGGSETYTYSWTSNPEGFISDEQSPTVSPVETTTYMVEVTDGDQVVYGEIVIVVNPLPEITLGDWPEMLCNQAEPPVQLTAEPESGIYSGDNVTADGIFSPESAPLGWNIITYTYEDEVGCVNAAQDSIFVDQCVGINSNNIDPSRLTIFPNPNNGKFIIESDELIESIELFNQLGKLVYTEKNSNNKLHFNTDLEKGIYYLKAKLIVDNQDVWIAKKVLIN